MKLCAGLVIKSDFKIVHLKATQCTKEEGGRDLSKSIKSPVKSIIMQPFSFLIDFKWSQSAVERHYAPVKTGKT